MSDTSDRYTHLSEKERHNQPTDESYPPESYQPGNCDVCGAPASKHCKGMELCGDCYAMECGHGAHNSTTQNSRHEPPAPISDSELRDGGNRVLEQANDMEPERDGEPFIARVLVAAERVAHDMANDYDLSFGEIDQLQDALMWEAGYSPDDAGVGAGTYNTQNVTGAIENTLDRNGEKLAEAVMTRLQYGDADTDHENQADIVPEEDFGIQPMQFFDALSDYHAMKTGERDADAAESVLNDYIHGAPTEEQIQLLMDAATGRANASRQNQPDGMAMVVADDLADMGYNTINDVDSVIVDGVSDFAQLFDDVQDVMPGREQFHIVIENRPDTAYVDFGSSATMNARHNQEGVPQSDDERRDMYEEALFFAEDGTDPETAVEDVLEDAGYDVQATRDAGVFDELVSEVESALDGRDNARSNYSEQDKQRLVSEMEQIQDSFYDATGRSMGPDQLYDRVYEKAREMGLDAQQMAEDGVIDDVADQVWIP